MATTFDHFGENQGFGSSLSWSQSSSGNFLVANVCTYGPPNPCTGVTCNGTPLVLSPDGANNTSPVTGQSLAQYTLQNPGTGTLNLVASFSSSVAAAGFSMTTSGDNNLIGHGVTEVNSGASAPTLTLNAPVGSLIAYCATQPTVGAQTFAGTLIWNGLWGANLQAYNCRIAGAGSTSFGITNVVSPAPSVLAAIVIGASGGVMGTGNKPKGRGQVTSSIYYIPGIGISEL